MTDFGLSVLVVVTAITKFIKESDLFAEKQKKELITYLMNYFKEICHE